MKIKTLWALLTAVVVSHVHALEVQPGDFEALPNGTAMGLLYYNYTSGTDLYDNDHKISSNAKLKANAGLARFIYATHPIPNLSIEPQAILPFAHITTGGDLAKLGKTTAIGDIIYGMPIKYIPSFAPKHSLAIAPYITLPTGKYDPNSALNVGENRWNSILQFAWLYHIYPQFTLENLIDGTIYGKNSNYLGHTTLKQNAKYEYQSYLRYNLSSETTLGIGGGWVWGGETKINEVNQHNRSNTIYGKLVATHFLTSRFQINTSVGKDFKVKNGVKQEIDTYVRFAYLF
ncbi:transporter [Acinetobacter sp. B5B]|uniref:transporter n=1 Tax=Acinetobacter baretiae TaxID=2605383 RepID=UPI0018C23B53|nr:transporter [Acinetobacter baretiae]MBF7683057.1 transporter [Acinetobacter baretiae]